MKKKKAEHKKGITENFLGDMPLFGDFFRELAKTETFKKRFEEVNEKIRENLKKGEKRQWIFEGKISSRPIIEETKKPTSEIAMGEDYYYEKKGNRLALAVKVPKASVDVEIKGKKLLISSTNFEKTIELPDYFTKIKRKQHNKGILMLELAK